MTKSIKIDETLENYISNNSYKLHPVQKEIVKYLDYIYEKANKTSNEKIAELKEMDVISVETALFQNTKKMLSEHWDVVEKFVTEF